MDHHDYADDDLIEGEEIEAYCVLDKQMVVMENPVPVWTRRGTPGTRGTCPICGGTIFRMGRTEAHAGLARPELGLMLGEPRMGRKSGRGAQTRYAAYINYAGPDAYIAGQLAQDLARSGVPTWFAPPGDRDGSAWAGGVHPALVECSHMVVVLSPGALESAEVESAWTYFRKQRKPVVVAQVVVCQAPDDLRSRSRFDFTEDYKTALRQMVQALGG